MKDEYGVSGRGGIYQSQGGFNPARVFVQPCFKRLSGFGWQWHLPELHPFA